MSKNEETIPSQYPYAWTPDSTFSVQDFLGKYKPSMVQNDGTKPWIWVRKPAPAGLNEGDQVAALEEASELLKEVTERVEKIKNDSSIPTRSNKKTGAKSKKEIREQVQGEATEKLKEISIRHGYVCGKWLIFAPAERVDVIWSNIAASLISGPLASTSAFSAKVSTSPEAETPNYQHIICLYMPDVYDKPAVTEVMKVLLRNHGVNLSGVKSDVYTLIGLDSKHSSGIPSTVWKNTSLMKDSEIKELKDAYFAELDFQKEAVSTNTTSTEKGESTAPKPKPPAKLKKKSVQDDPFVSEDDDASDHKEEEKRKNEVKSKKAPIKSQMKAAGSDPFASGDDSDEAELPRRKQIVKPKKTPAKAKATTRKRPQKSEDEEEDEEDEEERKPKKKRVGAK
ncbi:hypothetical protein JAAARDRAFT_37612 [Jaapia argillacea MUCL 33604]|uniref:Uncharacterized protein n=1 Tax=Jaapia argillacea MUCL 33604 TaxID=933084 RepID=A0A067PJW6_9AGAM|nr:hypothetical protein JAAARDRAFT_37612 [Jaapia argillacea MUCL 33604]